MVGDTEALAGVASASITTIKDKLNSYVNNE
jgi:hypothetical protein